METPSPIKISEIISAELPLLLSLLARISDSELGNSKCSRSLLAMEWDPEKKFIELAAWMFMMLSSSRMEGLKWKSRKAL